RNAEIVEAGARVAQLVISERTGDRLDDVRLAPTADPFTVHLDRFVTDRAGRGVWIWPAHNLAEGEQVEYAQLLCAVGPPLAGDHGEQPDQRLWNAENHGQAGVDRHNRCGQWFLQLPALEYRLISGRVDHIIWMRQDHHIEIGLCHQTAKPIDRLHELLLP